MRIQELQNLAGSKSDWVYCNSCEITGAGSVVLQQRFEALKTRMKVLPT
ncbi:MAG: hypothetical protein RHS_1702 [Robinsoniella sp. RHS]|nr:MAG: hypothetical protein RHS_1702 [Robinsoniella sp. RHS]